MTMHVHQVEKIAIPVLQNVLMWDALEREWRVGHLRVMDEGGEALELACTVEEANDALSEAQETLLPVFMEVTHWTRLPGEPVAASLGKTVVALAFAAITALAAHTEGIIALAA
jgi:hypothetical protein